MDTGTAVGAIVGAALDRDPGHPEAALFRVMMDGRTYAGMEEREAVAVSRELYHRWGIALAWSHPIVKP